MQRKTLFSALVQTLVRAMALVRPMAPALLSPSLLFVRNGQLVHAEYGWGPDSPGDVRAVIAKLQSAQ